MAIRVVCPSCEGVFNAPDGSHGKKAVCPRCSSAIRIPAAAPEPVAARRSPQPQAPETRAAAASSDETPETTKPAPLTAGQLVAAIGGPIDPVRPTLMYRLSILLSLGAMLLMPLVYLGVIAAACYAVYYHIAFHTFIFEGVRGRGAVYAFLIYLAPALIGPLMILFMIKPLFARPARHQKTRSLRRESEPVLFAFVDKICETVRAPKPKRIDIDCDVNASASFRKGMLSMLGNDLVLRLGMPLVAGLTVRQLGGVLAHEFGHFSQGAGMRLTYLVRSISHWFTRVVYERDEWDEWLNTNAREIDFRFA
ncbi:MAG: hypothetical protein AAGJ46_11240 [Planctomycetota bacterium]